MQEKYKVNSGHGAGQTATDLIDSWIDFTEKALKTAPKGSLNVKHRKGRPQYYQHISGKGVRYLGKRDVELIKALAQKDYNIMLLKVLKKKRSELKYCQEHYSISSIDFLYESLTPERKALVNPIRLTDSMYIKIWQDTPYRGKEFQDHVTSSFYTEKGERVRSKSEVIIANTLYRAGLPYKYECPLMLGGTVIYPDFTILDIRRRKERYLEHCGMMDNKEYLNSFMSRVDLYEENGLLQGTSLIMTFESSDRTLDTRKLRNKISQYFGVNLEM